MSLTLDEWRSLNRESQELSKQWQAKSVEFDDITCEYIEINKRFGAAVEADAKHNIRAPLRAELDDCASRLQRAATQARDLYHRYELKEQEIKLRRADSDWSAERLMKLGEAMSAELAAVKADIEGL